MTAKATLWRSKIAYGWEGHLDDDGQPDLTAKTDDGRRVPLDLNVTRPLVELLEQEHNCDAHFWPGHLLGPDGELQDEIPRCNKASLPVLEKLGFQMLFDVVVYDWDDPIAHVDKTGKTPARPDWHEALYDEVLKLPDCPAWYCTRRGARLIWELPKPLPPAEYVRYLRMFRQEVLLPRGFQVDDLKDVQRCYRLPKVVRDGKRDIYPADWSWLGEYPLSWQPPAGLTLADDKPAQAAGDRKEREAFDPKRPFAGITETRTPLQLHEKITENRNLTLTRMAGRLRHDGLQYEELLLSLSALNERRCEPPLDMAEVEKIARSICRYDVGVPASVPVAAPAAAPAPAPAVSTAAPVPEPKPKPTTADGCRFVLGSEREFAHAVCEDFEGEDGEKMVFDRGRVWRYEVDFGIWITIPFAVLHKHFTTYDGEWIHVGVDKKSGEDKFAPLKVSNRLTNDVVHLVSKIRHVDGFFDGAHNGLTFANGFVQARADGVHIDPFAPTQRSLARLPFAYTAGAKPTRFLHFLGQVLEPLEDRDSVVRLLREFIGVCLIGRATSFAKVLILVGEGANGKSTLLDIVSALFPDETLTAVPPQDMGNEYSRAMLVRSRLNVVNELPENDILESEAFKAIADGRRIPAREIRQAPFNYCPQAGHAYAANALPNVRDMTHGFWRRVAVVPFERIFEEHEQERDLARKIIDAELPAIASWALDGVVDLLAREHFDLPESTIEATKEWRNNTDHIQSFLEQKTEPVSASAPDAVMADRLYSVYRHWAEANGHKLMTSTSFGKRLKLLRVESHKRNNGRTYGVKLKAAAAVANVGNR